MPNKLGPLTAAFLVALTTTATATIRYVDLTCTNATPPFTNWITAATNIQDAVDAATAGDEILVTNGVYQTGSQWLQNGYTRLLLDKPITVRSVNGPKFTVIKGAYDPATTNGWNAIRCAYVTSNAVLAGFTLTNGATLAIEEYDQIYPQTSGGGAWASGGVVSNCIITGNVAYRTGGGAFWGTLINCTLANNSAWVGGATARSTLKNCIVTNNFASNWGDGGFAAIFVNCTVLGIPGECSLYNSIASSCLACSQVYRSCLLYASGPGDYITNAPLFVDEAGGNLRLQSNSPCINAGNNAYVASSTDLDGNPRIAGGTVDMGAYEFQGTGLNGFTAWLWQHGLRVDGTADYADSDGDTMNNWREWRCDTDPTNALSLLQMFSPASPGSGLTVSWQSVDTRSYFLERATDLGEQPPFQTLQNNITGQAGTTSYTDTNAVGNGPFLYRVGIEP